MNRSTYRNLMLAVLVACFGISYYVFTKSQDFQLQIAERRNDIIRLNQEYENARNLNVALAELDKLTIAEQTATQLDILRHLNLENSEITFEQASREQQAIGPSTLYTHTVRVIADMNYQEALALCDKLYSTKKIIITEIDLNALSNGENKVHLVLTGRIYGLDKKIPPVEMQPSPAVVQEGAPS